MAQNPPLLTNQRMFHGTMRASALADQLAARFNDRQHRTHISQTQDSVLVQIGSKHGTPLTLQMNDTTGGVLITMSRERDWLDRTADASELLERAATNPLSLLAALPDVVGEMRSENLPPLVWNAINDFMSLSRSLAGEDHAVKNPKVCGYCGTANQPDADICISCGAPLAVVLPRTCPKCGKSYTSDALFCQACGTRLVEG